MTTTPTATSTATSARKRVSLADCAREFWRHPSPWIIGTLLAGAVVARVVVGDFQLSDAILPFAMIATFPFFEWIIHVFLLHWRPKRIGGVKIDPLLSRDHRRHHADPRNVPLVFIPWKTFSWIVPLIFAVSLLAFPRLGLGLTYMVFTALFGLGYEWTHYLIHTDYKPKRKLYRAVYKNHRLHHFKNEHYWFTVTSSGTADRVLRTYPDSAKVATSPTAKALHAS